MTARLSAWDRRPDESAKAFAAFVEYRSMGEARSLERVSQEHAKAVPTLKKWSARHDWVARAAEFDTEAARRAGQVSLQDHATVRARQAKQARLLQELAMKRLEALDEKDTASITFTEASNALRVGGQEERRALGIPDAVHADVDVRALISFEYSDDAPGDGELNALPEVIDLEMEDDADDDSDD